MTATEQWIFLCAAHKTPKECPAIDYTRHTLDGAACLLNSNKYFPSRLVYFSSESWICFVFSTEGMFDLIWLMLLGSALRSLRLLNWDLFVGGCIVFSHTLTFITGLYLTNLRTKPIYAKGSHNLWQSITWCLRTIWLCRFWKRKKRLLVNQRLENEGLVLLNCVEIFVSTMWRVSQVKTWFILISESEVLYVTVDWMCTIFGTVKNNFCFANVKCKYK